MTGPGVWRRKVEPTWCPGCGNYRILDALTQALLSLKIEPWNVVIVSGIGQAGKLPHYVHCNFLHGLHGRALSHAAGVKLANPQLTVIAVGGDGDMYGEGGSHLVQAFRRNIDVTCLVHNNGVYGLTKGQPSPTAGQGTVTRLTPQGTGMPPFNPLALGLAADGTFIARGYANETEQLAGLIAEAITHRGFGFVDILQPCVTYNKVHTYEWFEERVYDLGHEEYRPADRQQAMQVALEWPELGDDRIALGVLYRGSRKTHEEQLHGLLSGPLTGPRINKDLLNKVADEFF